MNEQGSVDEKSLYGAVYNYLAKKNNNENMESKDIKNAVREMNTLFQVDEHVVESVQHKLEENIAVKMGTGNFIKSKDEHQQWFDISKFEMAYWERYKSYLTSMKQFPQKVVDSMEDVSSRIVGLLGDPNVGNDFNRYGLVIGDVQSGKTANYISVINMAADAGYKIIVLITGTLNNLRMQTQERIDEGFVGVDSKFDELSKEKRIVGVGEIESITAPVSFTSLETDFDIQSVKRQNIEVSSLERPVIFVIKKNTSVLKNLKNWFNRTLSENDRAKKPMLLIDDEADYASINTKKEHDPTATNKYIRELITLFPKANYLSYTATPFANVFIDPDSEDELLNQDLFPRDFIYALNSPDNYVGPDKIYLENSEHSYMLEIINDAAQYIKDKHDKTYRIPSLPPSMKEAIKMFMIANSIRDFREGPNTHRSMLINVSRFTGVQDHLAEMVRDHFKHLLRELKDNHNEKFREKNALYAEFSYLLKMKFCVPEEHDQILSNLYKANASILVTSVNSTNKADEILNYRQNNKNGLKVIAVGGQILSRGLTLEGLSTSYFYRNSRYYDTLMQMGRWFGFRRGYEDVCRIYMSNQASEWYGYITEAAYELKSEIAEMREIGSTPDDFGLKVLNNMTSLLISAPNKVKQGKTVKRKVNLSGEVVETPRLYNSKDKNLKNWAIISKFIEILNNNENLNFEEYMNKDKDASHKMFRNVDKETILSLVEDFEPHPSSVFFKSSDIKAFVDKVGSSLAKWDVVFISGSGTRKALYEDFEVNASQRKYTVREEETLQISGTNNRLGSSNVTKFGLTEKQIKTARKRWDETKVKSDGSKMGVSDKTYLRYVDERNPLLAVYLVELTQPKDEKGSKHKLESDFTIGLGIGFPLIDGSYDNHTITYKLNKRAFDDYIKSDGFGDMDE